MKSLEGNQTEIASSTLNEKGDPTANVRNIVEDAVQRLDDLRKVEVKRIDEKIGANKEYFDLRVTDTVLASNQRFEAQQLALKDALISQEKAVAAALEGTKEAITKADATTDKRFDLLSEKIDGVVETISKNVGERGVYVTHTDLANEMEKLRNSFEVMIRPVVNFMNSQTGQQKGSDDNWGRLALIIGATGVIVGIIVKFL